ncbi:helix-turn-helix domain-containing protein [Martelella sp. HB161492]|uniref:winged helix-turn-helix transcriptional regulator n=1 Tax=Martelella sp. HB161492 TaxID=2720726 RepID=UPI00158FC591|nr:helix-turn-helix domain-containing protein [Martelella sp. HB161492]
MDRYQPDSCPQFDVSCQSRAILDEISGKWSIMVLAVLAYGPQRFNGLKRRLDGITQKALTQTLRRLERNGLVSRSVIDTSPVAVEYALTPLGASLKSLYCALYGWTIDNRIEIDEARRRFDEKNAA